MKAEHGIPFRRWLAAAALACVSLNAHAIVAESTRDAAFDKFRSTLTGAGKQTVVFGSNGTPLAAPGIPSAAPDGGAGVKTTGTGSLTNPSGNRVAVTGVGRVSNANLGRVIGRILGRVIVPIGIAMDLKDLAEEGGFDLADNSSGGLDVRKKNPLKCTVGPCYEYFDPHNGGSWHPTLMQACQSGMSVWGQPANGGWTLTGTSGTAPAATYCIGTNAVWPGGAAMFQSTNRTRAPDPAGSDVIPSSVQEFEDWIAARTGWPTSSVIADAAAKSAEALGEKLPIESVTVTGPATSPGVVKIDTATNPDGSTKTTTSTTTHNHSYAGDVITTTTNTTINITNNGTLGNNTTEQKTEEPVEPKNPCEANPDTLGCIKLGDVPKEDVPKVTKTISYSEENLGFGGGACPAPIGWTDSLGSHALDLAPYCSILTSIVKPLVILFATLAAIFIIMPARTES